MAAWDPMVVGNLLPTHSLPKNPKPATFRQGHFFCWIFRSVNSQLLFLTTLFPFCDSAFSEKHFATQKRYPCFVPLCIELLVLIRRKKGNEKALQTASSTPGHPLLLRNSPSPDRLSGTFPTLYFSLKTAAPILPHNGLARRLKNAKKFAFFLTPLALAYAKKE